MHRFCIASDGIKGNQVYISGEEARHMATVLRLQPGDVVGVFDGSGYEYEVTLLTVTSSAVTGQVLSRKPTAAEPPVVVTLVQGVAKGEKMDYIIQKSVELGVSRIIPVQTEHSVVRLEGERAINRVKRWNRISFEACKQCGRTKPPVVEEVSRLDKVLDRFAGRPGILFYEQRKTNRLGDLINQHRRTMAEQGTIIFIGPEGGFSKSEVQTAEDRGIWTAGLGPRTLRTETAGVVALSILMWELGDLGGCSSG
ncbi:MAG: 16S rRNA (uracil(1498)-N(3))-methyltransferase [Bacillota bacterium]